MTSTTWSPAPAALDAWSVAELVAFHMSASENLTLCDDGHALCVEAAGTCQSDEDDEDGEICYGRGTCCCRRCDP